MLDRADLVLMCLGRCSPLEVDLFGSGTNGSSPGITSSVSPIRAFGALAVVGVVGSFSAHSTLKLFFPSTIWLPEVDVIETCFLHVWISSSSMGVEVRAKKGAPVLRRRHRLYESQTRTATKTDPRPRTRMRIRFLRWTGDIDCCAEAAEVEVGMALVRVEPAVDESCKL